MELFASRCYLPWHSGRQRRQEPIQTTLCETVKQPERFSGKLVEFRAQIESAVMYLPSGQGPVRVDPMSPTRFFNDAINAEIEFEKDGSALTLYQNGAVLKFKRE